MNLIVLRVYNFTNVANANKTSAKIYTAASQDGVEEEWNGAGAQSESVSLERLFTEVPPRR